MSTTVLTMLDAMVDLYGGDWVVCRVGQQRLGGHSVRARNAVGTHR